MVGGMLRSISRTTLLFTLLPALALAAPDAGTPGPDPKLLDRARSILQRAPFIDTHNDLPYALFLRNGGDLTKVDLSKPQPDLPADIPRLRAGRVGAQYWSIYVPSERQLTRNALHEALQLFDLALRVVESRPELELARSADDIERIAKSGRIASLFGVEGGHMVESSPAVVRIFHRLGARYLTLTHFKNVEWADSATDIPVQHGLTKFGERLVAELNRTGMFVDIAHVSPEVMRDVLRVSKAPVISSHSDAYALAPHPRNIPDDVLKLVATNGGVIHVSFIRPYVLDAHEWEARKIAEGRALRQRLQTDEQVKKELDAWVEKNPPPGGSVADVANVIDHIRQVAGVDHVGIGADYFDSGKTSIVRGVEGPDTYPVLFAELLRRGWSEEDLLKLAGRNHLRAMRQMEKVAAELQRTTPPLVEEGPRSP